jgi:hypothetical protein
MVEGSVGCKEAESYHGKAVEGGRSPGRWCSERAGVRQPSLLVAMKEWGRLRGVRVLVGTGLLQELDV